MQGAKDYLKNSDIMQRISFKDGSAHTVKMIKSKVDKIRTEDGEVEGVKFLVEEDGENKSFFTQSIGLIQKLADVEEGETVTIKMASKKINGQFRSAFVVSKGNELNESDDDTEVADDAKPPNNPEW